MTISPQSAIVLTGIYIAVHLLNQVEMQSAAKASLAFGGEGMVTLQPLQWNGGQITLGREWAARRACRGQSVAVALDARIVEIPPSDLARIEISETVIRESNGDGWIRLADDAGCRANPIPANQIEIKHLPGETHRLILWHENPRPRAKDGLARRLNAVRNNADCRIENTVRRCPLDPIGTDQIDIVFGEPQAVMGSGLPAHAVCWTGQPRHGCEVSDVTPDAVGYRAILGDTPSPTAIAAADGVARDWIATHLHAAPVQQAGIPL